MGDITVQEGARYRMRNGKLVGPIRRNDGQNVADYPWKGIPDGDMIPLTWRIGGGFLNDRGNNPSDLVECIQNPFTETKSEKSIFDYSLADYREAVARTFDSGRLL